MTLSDVAIKRPVFATMVSLGIVVLGVLGFTRLGVDLFPDVQFPVVAVTTVYPGASPAEVESQVSKPLEDTLVSLNGVDKIFSYSRESLSTVVIQFKLDVDIQEAATQVRERVAQARMTLPRQIDEPAIARFDVGAAPIVTYTLRGNRSTQELRDIADDLIRPQLEQVDGVASVRIKGGRERQINVQLDLERLEALGLTPLAVVEKIRSENLNVPAGSYGEGTREVSVRTMGEVRSVRELAALVITTGADGTLVRLSDIATVEDGYEDVDTLVRSNAEPAVVFEVLKASGRNTVEVAGAVKERLDAIVLPAGVRPAVIVDQAEFILENAHEVEVALVFGGAMAILVILFFMLDLRSTFISGIALPTAVVGTFFLMYVLDFTLNMMTLLGLSLAIGLLIDDAIVVRENIMKHLERGEDPVTAAKNGTREITLAVISTTLTVCAVFVPVAFMSGIVGQFFRQFGLTVAGATLLSTWVAFTLDPMLSARLAKTRKPGDEHKESFLILKRPLRWLFDAMEHAYAASLGWAVARRRNMAVVGLGAVVVLFGSCSLVPLMGTEFVAAEDRSQFMVYIELPAGTSLEETSRLSLGAERALRSDPMFVTLYSTVGPQGDSNKAEWRIVTVPKTERSVGIATLKERARQVVGRMVPTAKVSVGDPAFIEGAKDAPIMIFVRGDDLHVLERTAARFSDILRAIPGVTDVSMDYAPGKPELQLAVNRDRAASLGVPTALIAGTLRASVEGELAGIYRDGDDEVDIRVRLREQDRASEAMLGRVPIPTRGGLVPLSDVADISRGDGPTMIQRKDRSRVIAITAGAVGRPLGDIVEELEAGIAKMHLPEGVSYQFDGQIARMRESNENMLLALALGMVFIYLVLASQFESFLHPVTIMMALPLAVVGALVALFLQGSTLSMGAMIGIVLLMGLVTKNGILLVDHAAEKVREHGWTPKAAILAAGPARMRPLPMTGAAMGLGMLPTAFSSGAGSEFRSPMAMGVIGGVVSSTVLTLLVVPVFYLTMEWVRRAPRRAYRWSRGLPPVPEPAGSPGTPGATPEPSPTPTPTQTPAE